MAVTYEHHPHPHIAERRKQGPAKTTGEQVGLNGHVAVILTGVVGTMWCAYAFAILALVALPSAIKSGDPLQIVQWISQTFLQLVLLSVIMVGQNVLSRASDKRADDTYQDADATLHEAEEIQAHLKAQDDALNTLLDKLARLERATGQA